MAVRLDLDTVEAIRSASVEASVVVDRLEDPSGPALAIDWMRRIETVLASRGQPVAASIASLRAVVVASGRGRLHAEVAVVGSTSRAKIMVATTSWAIEQAVAELRALISADEARFREAETLAAHLVALAGARGIAADTGADGLTRSAAARWSETASADPDLVNGFTNLVALVGRRDSESILNRALQQSRQR